MNVPSMEDSRCPRNMGVPVVVDVRIDQAWRHCSPAEIYLERRIAAPDVVAYGEESPVRYPHRGDYRLVGVHRQDPAVHKNQFLSALALGESRPG